MSDYNFNDDYYDDSDDDKFIALKRIDNKKISSSLSKTPHFNYTYIDINKTDYCFSQDCFDNKDIKKYYEVLKKFSEIKINDVTTGKNRRNHNAHYYSFSICSKLKDLLVEIFGKTILKPENLPPIGSFGLYTAPEGTKANRETGVKSPRIYFFHYERAFYILFYDPYHEINPGK